MSSACFSFIIFFGLLALSCDITMKSLINPNSSTVWFLLASLSPHFWCPIDWYFCSSQPPTCMCRLLGLFVRSISLPSQSVTSPCPCLAMIVQLSQLRLFPLSSSVPHQTSLSLTSFGFSLTFSYQLPFPANCVLQSFRILIRTFIFLFLLFCIAMLVAIKQRGYHLSMLVFCVLSSCTVSVSSKYK